MSCVIKSRVSSRCPQALSTLYLLPAHLSLGSHLDCCSISVLVFTSPLLYLIMIPKCKSSDATIHLCQRSCKVLPLSEELRIFGKNTVYRKLKAIWLQASTAGLLMYLLWIWRDYPISQLPLKLGVALSFC